MTELAKTWKHYRARLDLWWAKRKRIAAEQSALHQRQRLVVAGRPPTGWYADPQNSAFERWWDGEAWGEQTRMAPPQAPGGHKPAAIGGPPVAARQSDHSGLVAAGWITFVLGLVFWPAFIAPFVIGIILAARGIAGHGAAMIVLSLLGPIISIVVIAAWLSSS